MLNQAYNHHCRTITDIMVVTMIAMKCELTDGEPFASVIPVDDCSPCVIWLDVEKLAVDDELSESGIDDGLIGNELDADEPLCDDMDDALLDDEVEIAPPVLEEEHKIGAGT
jgi:hypothetical protein